MLSSVGHKDCPQSVSRYSTLGGTWGYEVRCTTPSASSCRSYWESVANVAPTKLANVASTRLELPVGVSIYPRETNRPSRRWVDRWMPNLIHYNILDRGGHFAAWEQPALHAKEIRDCFAKVRRPRQTNLPDRDLAEP